jgi:CheY-like chemotaxis protein
MQRRILLVEDDHLQRNYVKQALEDELGADVKTLCCEKNFIDGFEKLAADPPGLAVLDIMLMWARPSKDEADQPPDDRTPEQAGLRCAAMLRNDPRTSDVKVLLYSVFPERDIMNRDMAKGAVMIVKEADCQNLFEEIQKLYPDPAAS